MPRNAYAPWPERDAELIALDSQGLSQPLIAARMGLSLGSVSGRINRLGPKGMLQRPWAPSIANRGKYARKDAPKYTPEQDALIDQRRRAGMTWDNIALSLGMPPLSGGSVRRHAGVMGLAMQPDPMNAPVYEKTGREAEGPSPLPAFHPLAWEELMRLTPSIAGPMHEMRPAVWGWGV